jgi:hypothetical protein
LSSPPSILERGERAVELAISIATDVIDDSMRVILHQSDYPLIEGVISGHRANNERRGIFLTTEGERSYPFEDVRQALLGFIDEMTATQNITVEDKQNVTVEDNERDAAPES